MKRKYPALTDSDEMPFGRYEGEPMQDVSPAYLASLWRSGCDDELVMNYIHNNKERIEQELGREI